MPYIWVLLGWLGSAIITQAASATAKDAERWVAQGDLAINNGNVMEALNDYRRAAKAGSVNGAFAAGDLLFVQAGSDTSRSRILKLSEALDDLLYAATNRHAAACARIAEAFQNGCGVRTNLTSAYSWQLVAAQLDPAFQPKLDTLVVALEPAQIQQAQNQARALLAGHWPSRIMHPVDQGDPRLEIQGVSFGPSGPLVVINGETLAPGESIQVPPANGPKNHPGPDIMVSCYETGRDYLLVSISGDPHLKLLPIEPR